MKDGSVGGRIVRRKKRKRDEVKEEERERAGCCMPSFLSLSSLLNEREPANVTRFPSPLESSRASFLIGRKYYNRVTDQS